MADSNVNPDLSQLVTGVDSGRIRDVRNLPDSHNAIDDAIYKLSSAVNRALLRLMTLRTNRLSNPTLTTPGKPIDGDVWVEATGVSPARTISIKVQDQGTTQTIATFTY